MTLAKEELDKILADHKLWLKSNGTAGARADLSVPDLWGTDLQGANLRCANLQGANLRDTNLRGADLQGANLRGTNLRGANLRGANLRDTNLWGANLRDTNLWGTNLDYADWPLWCGSLHVKVDKRIARQLAYHFCSLDCDDPQYIDARNAILNFANKFHLTSECGELEPIQK